MESVCLVTGVGEALKVSALPVISVPLGAWRRVSVTEDERARNAMRPCDAQEPETGLNGESQWSCTRTGLKGNGILPSFVVCTFFG